MAPGSLKLGLVPGVGAILVIPVATLTQSTGLGGFVSASKDAEPGLPFSVPVLLAIFRVGLHVHTLSKYYQPVNLNIYVACPRISWQRLFMHSGKSKNLGISSQDEGDSARVHTLTGPKQFAAGLLFSVIGGHGARLGTFGLPRTGRTACSVLGMGTCFTTPTHPASKRVTENTAARPEVQHHWT